ncbi:DbpA RNA binding domain-containing protein, partial [Rhizobium ruizarguesonis]
DFGASFWFSVSVGLKQNAEPRWLIPMLCRNGNVTKREIGAIKMQPEETFLEIAAASAEIFARSLLRRLVRLGIVAALAAAVVLHG